MVSQIRSATAFCFSIVTAFTVAVVVDTNMMAVSCMWNPDGSILAVCGIKTETSGNKESNAVQFYSAFGSVCLLVL